jgi:hypothetical protein
MTSVLVTLAMFSVLPEEYLHYLEEISICRCMYCLYTRESYVVTPCRLHKQRAPAW